MNNSLLVGCVADDFSGASDAASFLAKGGLSTVLVSGIPDQARIAADAEAVVIALKTRTQESASAVRESMDALRLLRANGAGMLYIKYCSTFDSTPKGNIGPICDAALEMLDVPYTLLCPSLPVNRRNVEKGRLYADGLPLEETHMRNHPLTPMWDSYIPSLMKEQSKYPCFILERALMAAGRDAVMKEIRAYTDTNRHFYLVPDYSTEEDAERILSLFGDLPLLTGGSGLMEKLAEQHVPPAPERTHKDDTIRGSMQRIAAGKALILAGSCSAATRSQVRHFIGNGGAGVLLDPQKLLSAAQSPQKIWALAEEKNPSEVMIYTPGNCDETNDSGGTNDSSSPGANAEEAAALETAMADCARLALASGVTRIIVAGGETSGAVIKALGWTQFQIGESIAPGVPVLIPLENRAIRIVLKSGNFGQVDFFSRALKATGG